MPPNDPNEHPTDPAPETGNPGASANPAPENTTPETRDPKPDSAIGKAEARRRARAERAVAAEKKAGSQGFIFQVAVVVGVALGLATLFTALQPGQSLTEVIAGEPARTTPTPIQRKLPTPGVPTPTLRNPNRVGIVAGHWKNDSGAVCPDGLKEVELNLEIATRVQKLLADQGYTAELLSEFDHRLNSYEAAALVSIHNDSCEYVGDQATGFKVASAMATHDPNLPARLTACLRARYGALTGLPLHSTSVTKDMTDYHLFDEISFLTPAAIIETGFMNKDREFLTKNIDLVSEGVANGILCYLRNEVISIPTIVP